MERDFEVAPFKATCYGPFPTLCLQVREVGDTQFENMFETPEGFEYEWGFDYVIIVEEHVVEDVPADGSSIRRVLQSVKSKIAVPPGSGFDLVVRADEGLEPIGSGRFRLYSGPEVIVCALGCDDLTQAVAQGARVRLMLTYPPSSGDPFPVSAWFECSTLEGPCTQPESDNSHSSANYHAHLGREPPSSS